VLLKQKDNFTYKKQGHRVYTGILTGSRWGLIVRFYGHGNEIKGSQEAELLSSSQEGIYSSQIFVGWLEWFLLRRRYLHVTKTCTYRYENGPTIHSCAALRLKKY
jgi:hypothetical protein